MAPGVDEAIAGASAGVTGTLLGYPLDALKGRMQASQGGLLINARALANSGVFSTYRGVTAPLINMAVLNTLSFSTYAQTRQLVGLPPLGNSTERDSALWRVCIAGSLVAVPITVVSTPFELVKLQTQLHPAGGALATAAAIYRRHGIGALYTGSIVNGAREVVFLGCYFTCYEKLKATLLADAHITHAVAVPVSGGTHCMVYVRPFRQSTMTYLRPCLRAEWRMRMAAELSPGHSQDSGAGQATGWKQSTERYRCRGALVALSRRVRALPRRCA